MWDDRVLGDRIKRRTRPEAELTGSVCDGAMRVSQWRISLPKCLEPPRYAAVRVCTAYQTIRDNGFIRKHYTSIAINWDS